MTYALDELELDDHIIQEHDIEQPQEKPKTTWKNSVEIPRWLLLLLANALIILLVVTFCIVFVSQEKTVGYGESCLKNSHCKSLLGLKCTAGTCACSTIQFWNGHQCVPQRTFNRSCTSQNQCSSLSKLLCMSVNVSSGTDTLCWCSSYR